MNVRCASIPIFVAALAIAVGVLPIASAQAAHTSKAASITSSSRVHVSDGEQASCSDTLNHHVEIGFIGASSQYQLQNYYRSWPEYEQV